MRAASGRAIFVAATSAVVSLLAFAGCPSTDALVNGIGAGEGGPPIGDGAAEGAVPPGVCGDGKRSPDEACEGADLGGATCADGVAPGWVGTMTCTATCTFDTTGCSTPTSTYNAINDATKWSFFDPRQLSADAHGYRGGAYDGRERSFFAPYDNGVASGDVAIYSNASGFTTLASWKEFDLTTHVKPGAVGFEGAAFDGKHVYFIPGNEQGIGRGLVVRYDRDQDINAATAWSSYDVSLVDNGAKGFTGAVHDGQYVYLVPNTSGATSHGHVMRYRKGAPFDVRESWEHFDLTTVKPEARGYAGGTFDGQYVYFAPSERDNVAHGLVARYDTKATSPFRSTASWTTFDATQVNAGASAFGGAVVDDRKHVYLVNTSGTIAMRYDGNAPFDAPSSWTACDMTQIDARAKGFRGGLFDGRYVYFIPYSAGGPHGLLVRYDTTLDFASATSWSKYDIATQNAAAKGFYGATFDGRYLYLIPYASGSVAARYDVKSPPWLPRLWNASFL